MTTEIKEQQTTQDVVTQQEEATPIRETRLRPVADVYRDEKAVRILLDLPGATDSDPEVEVHDGILSVKARVERSGQDVRVYERAFHMDRRMDAGAVEAELRNGVLTLTVPFREEARPRRITVKSS